MVDLSVLASLHETIKQYGLDAKKSLGQNFLLDQNLTDKIANAAGDLTGKTVFEIGSGPGGLTRSLLRLGAKKVMAIEYDDRAIEALKPLMDAAQGRLEIIHGDALTYNLLDLIPQKMDQPPMIIANLPYNIATPLLVGWLKQLAENPQAYASMTLMFQKEVVQRITAMSGDKHYGRLGVIANWLCRTRKLFDVPASAFSPPPKVTSSIVHLTPRQYSDGQPSFRVIEHLTEKAFGQRRKMIRSSLKEYSDYFSECGIDPTLRAENLTIDQFIRLSMAIKI